MKYLLLIITGFLFLSACSRKVIDIEPKIGSIDIPEKGEFRMWKDLAHGGFSVKLSNTDAKQSVELYTVKSNGSEKWVSPSLQANTSLTVKIPANGHLFIKNFNPNSFTLSYKINE